jgi:hypothetical protein
MTFLGKGLKLECLILAHLQRVWWGDSNSRDEVLLY